MPWVKGQSGNPKGKHGGKREKISAAYLNDLNAVWRSHGRAALVAAAEQEPAQFAAIVARLLPKETELNVRHDLSERFISAIRNAALPTSPSAGTVIDMTAQPVDEPKSLIPLDTQRSKDTP